MIGYFKIIARNSLPVVKVALWLPFLLCVAGESIKFVRGELYPFDGFRPISISVPNHCVGENPIIHVTRFSKKFSEGFYTTTFESDNKNFFPLPPFISSMREYKPRENFFVAVKFDDYFFNGDHRILEAGKWDGSVKWTFRRPWFSDTVIAYDKIHFEVWSKLSEKCEKEKEK